eukprot:ANDGO_05462.mRNA.1 DNA ligase 3
MRFVEVAELLEECERTVRRTCTARDAASLRLYGTLPRHSVMRRRLTDHFACFYVAQRIYCTSTSKSTSASVLATESAWEELAAFFRLVFPKHCPDRVFYMREQKMAEALIRALGWSGTAKAVRLRGLFARGAGCCADLAETVADMASVAVRGASQQTVRDVDCGLQRLANSPDAAGDVIAEIGIGAMCSIEIKWLVRIMLREMGCSGALCEDVVLEACRPGLAALYARQRDLSFVAGIAASSPTSPTSPTPTATTAATSTMMVPLSLDSSLTADRNGDVVQIDPGCEGRQQQTANEMERPDESKLAERQRQEMVQKTRVPENREVSFGVFVTPQLCGRAVGVEWIVRRSGLGRRVVVEEKMDGERLQAHVCGNDVSIFSRSSRNSTESRASLVPFLRLAATKCSTCIVDGELLVVDEQSGKIETFGTVQSFAGRQYDPRRHLCVVLFDILYLNGQSLVDLPLVRRREIIREWLVEVPRHVMLSQGFELDFANTEHATQELQRTFDACNSAGTEGLVIKDLGSRYIPGDRSLWMKLKRDYIPGAGDTVDLVLLGVSHGARSRHQMPTVPASAASSPSSSFFFNRFFFGVVHATNPQTFEIVCETSVGIPMAERRNISEMVGAWKEANVSVPKRSLVVNVEQYKPDFVIIPTIHGYIVADILGSGFLPDRRVSSGLAIRHPRIRSFRSIDSLDPSTLSAASYASVSQQGLVRNPSRLLTLHPPTPQAAAAVRSEHAKSPASTETRLTQSTVNPLHWALQPCTPTSTTDTDGVHLGLDILRPLFEKRVVYICPSVHKARAELCETLAALYHGTRITYEYDPTAVQTVLTRRPFRFRSMNRDSAVYHDSCLDFAFRTPPADRAGQESNVDSFCLVSQNVR